MKQSSHRVQHSYIEAKPLQKVSPGPKMNPYKCLLSSTLNYSDKNYAEFRVKLRYTKKLVFYEPSLNNDEEHHKQLPSVYRRMKYLQHLQVTSFIDKANDNIYKIMRRLRSVKIGLQSSSGLYLLSLGSKEISPIFKYLKRLNLAKLSIKTSFLMDPELRFLRSMLTCLVKGLKCMINLKALSVKFKNSNNMFSYLEANENRSRREPDHILTKRIFSSFQRLTKIEKLSIDNVGAPSSLLEGFLHRFDHLPKLKAIKTSSDDQIHGKKIADNLSGMKSLTFITFIRCFEPNDIISLAIKTPSLKSITIKDDECFHRKDMLALESIKNGELSVFRLHLDLPIKIKTEQDSDFIVNFLRVFPKIRSLHLSLRCDKSSISYSIAKQINKFAQLQEIELGLLVESGAVLGQFLSQINNLTQLKLLSLLIKTTSEKGWDPDIDEIYQAMRGFFIQSKTLTEVNLGWDKFSPQCAELFDMVLNDINDLDKLHLRYRPISAQHGKTHNEILKIFEKTFKKTTAKFQDVAIVSHCTPQGRNNDCKLKTTKLNKTAFENPNIKEFYSIFSPYPIPYFRDCLDKLF